MDWHKITVSTNISNEEILTDFLTELANGISIDYSIDLMKSDIEDFEHKFRLNPDDYPEEDVRLTVYFDNTVPVQEKLSEIKSFIDKNTELTDKENIQIDHSIIQEKDWENEWKKYFHSFRVSKSFLIVPSWELDDQVVNKEDKLIKLDPGMAFGTGDHPTTSMCLQYIEDIVTKDKKIIDVGTGSGILTIGAYLMGARDLTATDIDQLSLKVARENFQLNEIEGVDLHSADLLKNEDETYDIVIANILAHVIELMIEDAYKVLKNGGYFISSGIITEKKEDILKQLTDTGFTIQKVLENNGWVSILAQKED